MFLSTLRRPLPPLTKVTSFRQIKTKTVGKAWKANAADSRSSDNPIAAKIDEGLEFGKRRSKGNRPYDLSRINILSDNLCSNIIPPLQCCSMLTKYTDDIIQRLAPSLEKYKGCDVIDVNPGACIWSKALHDHLKPRSHILLESDTGPYEPFYKPLLDKKGSTYKLVPESGLLWQTWNSISEHLPNQELLTPGDPRLDLPNHTLLFTANLCRLYRPHDRFQLAHLFMHQLMSASRNHAIFQKYGLIRMLLWVEDSERYTLLPRVISLRNKYSAEAELSWESIVEVASGTELVSLKRREHQLELDRAMQVVGKMQIAGINTPKERAGPLELEARKNIEEINLDDNSKEDALGKRVSTLNRPYVKELRELEARFQAGDLTKWMNLDVKLKKKDNTINPDYARMQQLQYRLNSDARSTNKMDDKIAQYMDIMEREQATQNLPAHEAEIEKAEVSRLFGKLKDDVDALFLNARDQFWLRVHDRLACQIDPPLLYWDRRPFEPLKIEPEEFHPKAGAAFYDIQPRAIDAVYRSMENYDQFDYILGTLWQTPTQSILTGIESLAHGAREWLLPRCPSLTDVSRGGSSDLEYLVVRRLTQEHYKEIMEAWISWPFKPTFEQIMARTGTPLIFVEDELNEL